MRPDEPEGQRRRSIRLPAYDYTQAGAYFVTICTQKRDCVLGAVLAGQMHLNELGTVAAASWGQVPYHFPGVELDAYVVMPNHLHGIVILAQAVGARSPRPVTGVAQRSNPRLGQIVAYAKYQSTKRANELRATPGLQLWQRNYYDHIIRNDEALARIREYVVTNPTRWELDRENPVRAGVDPFDQWLDVSRVDSANLRTRHGVQGAETAPLQRRPQRPGEPGTR